MPLGLVPLALSAIFKNRSSNKRNNEQRRATTAQLTLAQKQREDARRARFQYGASLLEGVPGTTAGGRVNTNVALDPELVRSIGAERTYDFAGAVPNQNAGAGSAFAAGLIDNIFSSADETAAYMAPGAAGAPSVPGGVPGLSIDQLLNLRNGNTTEDDG